MTRRTVAQIKSRWPLLVILASVFWTGYQFQGETVAAREKAISAMEQRVNTRVNRIEKQLDETNALLLKILIEVKRQ